MAGGHSDRARVIIETYARSGNKTLDDDEWQKVVKNEERKVRWCGMIKCKLWFIHYLNIRHSMSASSRVEGKELELRLQASFRKQANVNCNLRDAYQLVCGQPALLRAYSQRRKLYWWDYVLKQI